MLVTEINGNEVVSNVLYSSTRNNIIILLYIHNLEHRLVTTLNEPLMSKKPLGPTNNL